MALNKFCPVAQGEYYNNKSLAKSQQFFPVFLRFFFCLYNYNILWFALFCMQYMQFNIQVII